MSASASVITIASFIALGSIGGLSAEHQAIYCGAPGTETSLPFAEAVLSEVRRMEARGFRDRRAWDALTVQYCRGQETPK